MSTTPMQVATRSPEYTDTPSCDRRGAVVRTRLTDSAADDSITRQRKSYSALSLDQAAVRAQAASDEWSGLQELADTKGHAHPVGWPTRAFWLPSHTEGDGSHALK